MTDAEVANADSSANGLWECYGSLASLSQADSLIIQRSHATCVGQANAGGGNATAQGHGNVELGTDMLYKSIPSKIRRGNKHTLEVTYSVHADGNGEPDGCGREGSERVVGEHKCQHHGHHDEGKRAGPNDGLAGCCDAAAGVVAVV